MSNSATPWTSACQAPLSMVFSMQDYWSGLPFHIPGDLPDSGTESMSPVSPALAGDFFSILPPEKPHSGYSGGHIELILYNILNQNLKSLSQLIS